MLSHLLPPRADNGYHGARIALWLFGVVVVVKSAISVGTILNGRAASVGADGIPLDAFTPVGAQAFVSMLAAWGLSHLMLNTIGVLVLLRYRALVPLMFVLLLLEHLSRQVIYLVLPMPRTGARPGLFINWALATVMIVGLIMSLHRARREEDVSAPEA